MFKALHLWLPAYLRRPRRGWTEDRETHFFFCECDHFEPFHDAGREEALARVRRWRTEYPPLAAAFRDSGGQAPRRSFFYPIEQYDEGVIDELAALCRETRCETEIHLHHENDTATHLAETLAEGKGRLAGHGLLSEDSLGNVRYGFIHGNWALDNSHPKGIRCGVTGELRVLKETGCYADFTMPSSPDVTQTRTINSVYYARPGAGPKSHNAGIPARAGVRNREDFLLVQGPLGLNWRRRKWGILPRVENGDLTPRNPPTAARLRVWLDICPRVEGRPEWIFAKLHTHGGLPRNMSMLLGRPMHEFHRTLFDLAARHPSFKYHYVTARELVNIVHAAEAGKAGNPGEYRDFEYRSLIRRQ